MANSYTPIYLHLVFAVKNRESLIKEDIQPALHSYLAGILAHRGHTPIIVGGIADHVHLLFRYNINELLPDLVRELKVNSGKFISGESSPMQRFYWQGGYGCFSVSFSKVGVVKNYIMHQAEHHKKQCFRDEFREFLDNSGEKYDERYLPTDVV